MAIRVHRRIRKAAHDAVLDLRGKRARKPSQSGTRRGVPGDPDAGWVDERLSAVLADVRAGQFKETTWHFFRLMYFPALDHYALAELLDRWSRRNGLEVKLRPADLWIGNQRCAAIPNLRCQRHIRPVPTVCRRPFYSEARSGSRILEDRFGRCKATPMGGVHP
jgi:hypothetical protein